MAGVVTTADGSLTVTTPVVSEGSVWDGCSPEPGELWVYGPGAAQVGHYAVGSTNHALSVSWASLEQAASMNHVDLAPWRAQRARFTGPRADRLVGALRHGFTELDEGSEGIEFVHRVLFTLTDRPLAGGARDRRSSSRTITREALSWVEANDRWFPSLAELCLAVAVSERRLHYAFVDVFDVPPGRYLRLRALNAVRGVLRDPASLHRTITNVAIEHGFHHPSLFGKHYRRTFGETPSETRRRAAELGRSQWNALAGA